MILKINENETIDWHGYRILDNNGLPINADSIPLTEIPASEIEKAKLYVIHLAKTKNIIKRQTSGTLKHNAEDYLRCTSYSEKCGDAYISNGAMIVAMIENGFDFLPSNIYGKGKCASTRVFFNVSSKGCPFFSSPRLSVED